MNRIAAPAAILAILLLAGCAAPSPAPDSATGATVEPAAPAEPAAPPTATEVADVIAAAVGATSVTTITEDNDPNDLIGRPTGYVDAAVIQVAGFECPEPAASCGATVEVWKSTEDAQARADYIFEIQKSSPMFGSEYHFVSGTFLLRLNGDVVPSEAGAYETAFLAAVGG